MKSVNERLRDELIAHTLFSGRYSTGVARSMVKVLNDFDAELTASLIVALDNTPIDINSFTARRLESLLSSVRNINKQAVDSAFSALTDEIKDYASYEVGYYTSLFEALLPDVVLRKYPLMGITEEMLFSSVMSRPFQGKLLTEWAGGLEADRMARINNAVRNGYLNGDSAVDIGRKIRGHENQSYKDGALQLSRANATTIAKTAINHLQATARDQFADANKDILDCKQWLSTLDNKTSHDCIVRDRLKYTLEGKPIGHKIPYLQGPGKIHFNCRSTETLVTKSWRELGIDLDEMDIGTRASMDGQVPADTTYLEWIERQPEWRQKQVFGEARYRLIKEGKVKPSELFSDKGEYLTLNELRKRERFNTNKAEQTLGFSLSEAKSFKDVEYWMRGRVAHEVAFPEGVPLKSAKIVAQAANDVIERFGLQPVNWIGTKDVVRSSAAGAYFPDEKQVHIAKWAYSNEEWNSISENSKKVDLLSLVSMELQNRVKHNDVVLRFAPENIQYAAVLSVKGSVLHEFGHHLYYSMIDETRDLAKNAYNEGWWRAISVYSAQSEKELFAECVAIFMENPEANELPPEIKEWLKKNSRSRF